MDINIYILLHEVEIFLQIVLEEREKKKLQQIANMEGGCRPLGKFTNVKLQ